MAEVECKKVRYANKAAADFDVSKYKNKPLNDKRPTRSYRCNLCDSWHITSKKFVDHKKVYELNKELGQTIFDLNNKINKLNQNIKKLESRIRDQNMELYRLSAKLYSDK